MVVIMVLCPRRDMGWCGTTMSVVTALLARRWFASRPMRHGLRLGLLISRAHRMGVGSLAGYGADGHDPEFWGRGFHWLGRPQKLRLPT
jgi:hypothetical protein